MRLLTLLLTSLLLAGCIPVVMRPTVDSDSRGNVPENQQTSIQVGTSHRADVLLELGEPDGRARDEGWYVYSLTRTSGVGGFLIFAGGGSAGAIGGVVGSQDMTRILVRFDPAGNVTSVEPEHLHCKHYLGGLYGTGSSSGASGESKPCTSPTGADLEGAVVAPSGQQYKNPHNIRVIIPAQEFPEPAAGPADVPLQLIDRRTNSKMALKLLGISGQEVELQPGEMQLVRTVVEGSLQQVVAARATAEAAPQVTCELVDFSVIASDTGLYSNVSARVEWVIRVGTQQRTVSAESRQRAWVFPSPGVVQAVVVKALRQAAADTGRAATEELLDAANHAGG
jgi:outer membrane protein assembly factor BamE (lipoprotein component of BamABCDE complex)